MCEAPVSGTVVSVGAYNPSGVETATGEYNVSDGQLGSVVSGSSLASVLASNDANSPADLPALTFALNARNNTVAGLTPNGIGIAVQGAINSDYFVSLPPNSIPAPVASSDLSAQEVLINQLNNVDYVNQSDVTNSIGQDQNIYVPQSGGDLSFTTYSNGGDASPASLASPSLAAPMSGTVAAVAINVTGHAVSTTPEATATASFDATDDGGRVPIGWITSGEGLLITDPNGSLTSLSGANLVQSFAALKALDVEHTGSLNASDPGWASLRVWKPASSGSFVAADAKTLAQLGITAIDLNPVLATTLNNGNLIYGTDTATLHGHAAALAQLGLSYNPTLLHPASMTLN